MPLEYRYAKLFSNLQSHFQDHYSAYSLHLFQINVDVCSLFDYVPEPLEPNIFSASLNFMKKEPVINYITIKRCSPFPAVH